MTLELNLRFPDAKHVIVRLGPDDDGSGGLPFTNPITEKDLHDLQWYVETYGAHSLGDPDDGEAKRISDQLPTWGKALFNAVFTERETQRRFNSFQDAETGYIWKFTVPDYLTVDDFESYTNELGSRVFEKWIDGIGFTQPEPGNEGNGTGAAVGHDVWSPDSPHFEGTIMETANVYDGDPTDIAGTKWIAWEIDLASVGVGLTNITTLTIGIEGGETGVVYVDAIRLTKP